MFDFLDRSPHFGQIDSNASRNRRLIFASAPEIEYSTTSAAGRATLSLLAEQRTLTLEELEYAFEKLAANASDYRWRIFAAFPL
jgi:hypothetical protein